MIFEENTFYKGGYLRPYLLELRPYQCECCKMTEWMGQPIPLEVHHKDGDRTNNTLENLLLLCPNCHHQTDNFGSYNKKSAEKRKCESVSDEDLIQALNNNFSIRAALLSLGLSDASANYKRPKQLLLAGKAQLKIKESKEDRYCIDCGKKISYKAIRCADCARKNRRVIERPTRIELKELIRNFPFVTIAERYGVSDNAIKKWCDMEKLPRTKKEIKIYSDEEWKKI